MCNDLFASIYELWGALWLGQFSTDMYVFGLYCKVGIIMAGMVLFFMSVYYYPKGNPRFNRWYHWLLYILVFDFINAVITYFVIYSKFDLEIPGIHTFLDYLPFLAINFIWIIFWSAFYSFAFRWWSINCSRTPIPN